MIGHCTALYLNQTRPQSWQLQSVRCGFWSAPAMSRFQLPMVVLGVLVCSCLFFNHLRKAEDDIHAVSLAVQTNAIRLLQNELAKAASTRERLEKELRSGFENATAAFATIDEIRRTTTTVLNSQTLERLSGELVYPLGENVGAHGQSRKELEERVDGKITQAVSTLREELDNHRTSLSPVLSNDKMAMRIADLQERHDSVKEEINVRSQSHAVADVITHAVADFTTPAEPGKAEPGKQAATAASTAIPTGALPWQLERGPQGAVADLAKVKGKRAERKEQSVIPLRSPDEEAGTFCAEESGTCECTGTMIFGRKFVSGMPGAGTTTTAPQLMSNEYKQLTVDGSTLCISDVMGGDPALGYY